ncbi:EAL domain-containing protein [Sporosarcina sp. YIM B06819]|uniref:EAL domain-containing protein n=1 Tax=Sporosarcina sp. YIM B06819 TaxID=3081769 RepID=UPI00298BE997|nr:EAL domain-containing protein [Sporosarcina sp. YIM B06819]
MSNLRKADNEKIIILNWLKRFGSRFRTGFVVKDPNNCGNQVVFANEFFMEMTGYSSSEIMGSDLEFIHGEDTDMALIQKIDQDILDGMSANAEVLNYKKDGTPFWNELVIQPIIDERGANLFTIVFSLDVTERKKDNILLELQEDIFVGINAGEEAGILFQKIANVIKSFFWQGTVCSILFKGKKEDWHIGAADAVPPQLMDELLASLSKSPPLLNELVIREKQEACLFSDFQSHWSLPIVDGEGAISGLVTLFNKKSTKQTETQRRFLENVIPIIQMTKIHYSQQAEYYRLAFTDPETGLPNRHAFLNKLKKNIEDEGKHFVAILEPGEFAKIVDLYGREAADELFIQLSRRIERVGKGKPNFVGRFASAALIFTNVPLLEGEEYFIIELKNLVKKPFIISGQEMFITLKIGVAISGDNCSGEDLIRHADRALSDAKNKPGNIISFYKDLQYKETMEEMRIFNELSKALLADEMEVFLQPQVDLKDGSIISFEALARWFSPILGQVPPDLFIPAAESTGKIIELETCILSKVMEWQRTRQQSGEVMYPVAVNISAQHFFTPTFVEMLKEYTQKYDLSPEYITLELTESIGLFDLEKAKEIFDKLNGAGFEISVDDFGVGFSSLSYLPKLPLSELKIDRSFINAIGEPATLGVVTTIIQLAENLKLSTVAEGIEEEWQGEMLRTLGCKVGQGFYYYKPMPLSEVDRLLSEKEVNE